MHFMVLVLSKVAQGFSWLRLSFVFPVHSLISMRAMRAKMCASPG